MVVTRPVEATRRVNLPVRGEEVGPAEGEDGLAAGAEVAAVVAEDVGLAEVEAEEADAVVAARCSMMPYSLPRMN